MYVYIHPGVFIAHISRVKVFIHILIPGIKTPLMLLLITMQSTI